MWPNILSDVEEPNCILRAVIALGLQGESNFSECSLSLHLWLPHKSKLRWKKLNSKGKAGWGVANGTGGLLARSC